MSIDQNKAKYRKVIKALSKGEATVFDIIKRKDVNETAYAIASTKLILLELLEEGIVERNGNIYRLKNVL